MPSSRPLPLLLAVVMFLLAPALPALAQFDSGDSPFGGDGFNTEKVEVSASPSTRTAAPGETFVIAVVLDHQPGWHSWPAEGTVDLGPDFGFAVRTTITAEGEGFTFGPVQWPETHLAKVPTIDGSGSVEKPTYQGKAIAFVPVLVAQDAPEGTRGTITLSARVQACDDTSCDMPRTTTLEVGVDLVALAQRAETTTATADPVFATFDASVFSNTDAWGESRQAGVSDQGPTREFFGIAIPSFDGAAGYILAALLSAVGGLVLNLTPCVLPVIPIKIMSLSQHAKTPGKSMVLGLWMAAGVVGFWTALGVLAATATNSFGDPSRIFGYWFVTLGIGLLIIVMGVGIMGAFNINLPQSVYKVNPKADSPHGSFLFGVMTAVLGLPCFGFVAGALLAGSATMPWTLILTIFAGIGVGMAAPYLVLSAKPSLVSAIPKTGPGSELVKQVMGLLLLAAGAYFAGSGVLALIKSDPARVAALPWWVKTAHWWLIGLFAAAAGLWLSFRTIQISKKFPVRGLAAVLAFILAGGGIAAAVDQTSKAYHDFWQPFTPELLATAQADGRVVVLDFTADWCLNCKALEATVLLAQPVKSELLASDVVPIKADLTSTTSPGWDKLRELGQTGIPTLAIYGPGLEKPWTANAYTSGQVQEVIERARGR